MTDHNVPEPATASEVVIVDDEAGICVTLRLFLEMKNFPVRTAESGERCLELLRERPAAAVVSDIKMDGMSGLDLLARIRREWPETEVVLLTGYGAMEHALEAIRLGAFDFLLKPVEDLERDFFRVLAKALERHRLVVENRRLSEEVRETNERLKATNRDLRRTLALFESLYRTAQSVTRLSRADDVLDLALDVLVHGFGIESAAILLAAEGAPSLAVARSVGLDETSRRGLSVGRGDLPFWDALSRGHSFRVEDAAPTFARLSPADRRRLDALWVVPISVGRVVAGALVVFGARDREPIGDDEIQRFSILAGQVAPMLKILGGV